MSYPSASPAAGRWAAIDATLVRLVLVPAVMELLGKANWWLPRPLARVLPGAAPAAASGTEPLARDDGVACGQAR